MRSRFRAFFQLIAILVPSLGIAVFAGRAHLPPVDPSQRLAQKVQAGTATPAEMVRLGEAYLLRGEVLKAAELAFRARAASPEYAHAHHLLGVAYGAVANALAVNGRPSEVREQKRKAEESFLRAVQLDPTLLSPRLNLARIALEHGDAMRALVQLQAAVRQNHNTAELWTLIGQAQRMRGSHTVAQDSFRRALAVDPNAADAHVSLAVLHIDFDRPALALPHLEAAYRLGDRSPITLAYYALALTTGPAKDTDMERAAQLLDEARHPQIPPAWFAEGQILRRRGNIAEARAMFQRVLKEEPRHQRALFAIADAYRLEGDQKAAARAMEHYHGVVTARQRATSLADRLSEEGPRPALLRDYGQALLDSDRPAEALEQFRHWARLAPQDTEARRWIERAAARLRREAEAS